MFDCRLEFFIIKLALILAGSQNFILIEFSIAEYESTTLRLQPVLYCKTVLLYWGLSYTLTVHSTVTLTSSSYLDHDVYTLFSLNPDGI